ncbi:MAG: alkaline phosphatase family protein [Nanoarchaeota archaeon]
MKGVLIILDGCADEPCYALGDKTPLEAAKTPNLDVIAAKSKIDNCYTVKRGIIPNSLNGTLSLLGYSASEVARGAIEALGLGVKLKNGDFAFRCNFGTIDNLDKKKVIDRRAARTLTTKEAKILAKAINNQVRLPFKFKFLSSIQHRAVLVIEGNFSKNITDIEKDEKTEAVEFSKPLNNSESAELTAHALNSFACQSFSILNTHPINIKRIKRGLYPANFILCRGASSGPVKLKKIRGKWLCLGYMPLEIGIGRATGMGIYSFTYPKLRDIDVYKVLYKGLQKAIKNAIRMLKKKKEKYDYFYIHFKEPDIPGHDNKPFDKVKMIEILDKEFFSFIRKFIGNSKLVITCDHTTSCRKKSHSELPVPVLIYPQKEESKKRFTENQSLQGKCWLGKKLLEAELFRK